MNKRQRKKAWKQSLAPKWQRWFGVPMPRRITQARRQQITTYLWQDQLHVLVDAIYRPTPLMTRLMAMIERRPQ